VRSPIFLLYLSQVEVIVALALAEVVIICGLVWHLLLGVNKVLSPLMAVLTLHIIRIFPLEIVFLAKDHWLIWLIISVI
jgi:hypothetical protein